MNVSVVVPVYNGEAHLQELVARLGVVLPSTSGEFEAILVNDGSSDRSWEVICFLAEEYSWVLGIDLMRNYGQHNALLAGIRAAQYEVIVTVDDDLQHPPEEIPALLAKLGQGYDLVYGMPGAHQRESWRITASYLMRLILFALGDHGAVRRSSFRAFQKRLREAFAQYQNPFVVIDALLARAVPRTSTVIIQHSPRRSGKSNYTVGSLISLGFTIITSNTIQPLQVAIVIGLGAAPLCLGLLIAGLVQLPTREMLWSVLAMAAGIQWLALWIVGEYMGRMHLGRLGQPPYIVREMTTKKSDQR